MSPQWDERVGDTRFRRSDLPIGGGAAMAFAFGSLVSGHPKAAAVLAGAGLGATAGSLAVALIDPLPASEAGADDSTVGSAPDVWNTPPSTVGDPVTGTPSAPASDSERPASALAELADDDVAEQELEQAAAAVEHQASYGSPSFDDMDESADAPSEPEVTGSAPQEGQSPLPDAWFDDKDA